MKKVLLSLILTVAAVSFLSGCVAIPPLIQVQHRDTDSTSRKLDAIEKRLDGLERKIDQGPRK